MSAIVNYSPLDFSAVDRASLQPSTRIKYKKALERFNLANVPEDRLAEYAASLKPAEKSFLKAALKIVSTDGANRLKAMATPENLPAIQAALLRVDAMNKAITVRGHNGNRLHNFLSASQVKKITAIPEPGSRDWIVLGLLLGAGLRREELVGLKFSDIQDIPTKTGMRTVVQIRGKGDKVRSVPIQPLLAKHLREWEKVAGSERVIDVSAVRVFAICRKYGKKIRVPGLAPHDMRRTYAQLAYQQGVPLTQISVLLGHSSLKTTQKYLSLELDLESTASDFIPLSGD